MVTAAEMSTIVGTTVAIVPEEGGGKMACTYQQAGSITPFIKIEVAWGDGDVALSSSRMLGRLEPGIAARMAGLGDEATAIGPALWVRTGEDLVTLTIMGVDDNLAAAKRIITLMRPRMGPSAAPRATGAGSAGAGGSSGGQALAGDSGSAEIAKAAQLVGGLLKGLAAESDRSHGSSGGTASASGPSAAAKASATSARPAETFAPAKGPSSIRIPLIAGLTIVGARHEPPRGDYEPMLTVAAVADDKISTVYSASLPEGVRVQVDRAHRREDLHQAREYRPWYQEGDPLVFPGTTAMVVSRAVFTDLTTKGEAAFVRIQPDEDPFAAFASRLTGGANASIKRYAGTLRRVEPHTLAFPVLVNDEPVELPVIHARGTFEDDTVDFYVFDNPDLPLILYIAGQATGRIVRIGFPVTAAAAPIEEKLKKESRVALHGICFDFNKATIRPESESVLREIAAALTHNPDWRINIEGHTDNIGGDAFNLDLSRRRAEAVKQALIDRYRVPATTLTSEGFGLTRPDASNDTLSGRARNRRVELVRQ